MKMKYLIVLAVSVILFTAAVIGYNYLSSNYSPDDLNGEAASVEVTTISEKIQTTTTIAEETAPQSDYGIIECTFENIFPEETETELEAAETTSVTTVTEETTDQTTAEPIILELQTADFTVYDLDGQPVTLSSFLGKPVIVNFWASWCIPCVDELPLFDELYKQYGSEAAFLMINVPMDGGSSDKVKAFAEENGYTFPVYCDTEFNAADAYGIWALPETLFISSNGELVKRVAGGISEDKLEECFEAIYTQE